MQLANGCMTIRSVLLKTQQAPTPIKLMQGYLHNQ